MFESNDASRQSVCSSAYCFWINKKERRKRETTECGNKTESLIEEVKVSLKLNSEEKLEYFLRHLMFNIKVGKGNLFNVRNTGLTTDLVA